MDNEKIVHHPQAHAEARQLVDRHDGSAGEMIEDALRDRVESGEVDEALQLDQVRREIEKIYDIEGK